MPSDAMQSDGQSLMGASKVAAEDSNDGVKSFHGGDRADSSSKTRTSSPLFCWWLEGLAILASLLLLAAIIVVLKQFDGGEQPNWPYWININTLVATLSTILKAQLLVVAAEAISQYKWYWFHRPRSLIDFVRFDEASRGLMGSLNFLSRPQKSYIALCSALIFVLSAVIGPFTQQTIRTFGCELPSRNESASVPIAEYLDYTIDIGTYRVGSSRVAADPSPHMSIAVLGGIVGSSDQVNPIQASCPTGNCDFPSPDGGSISYSSLAVCSSCEDISESIFATHIVDEDYAEHLWSYNLSQSDPSYLAIRDGSQSQFMFKDSSLPFFNIQAPNREGFGSRADYSPSTNITFMSFTWAGCSMPIDYTDDSDWLEKVDCSSYSRFPGLQEKVGLVAANCSLHLCVRNYMSKVRNGELQEETISVDKDLALVDTNITTDDVSHRFIKTPCLLDGQRYDSTNLSQVAHHPGRNFTRLLVNDESVEVPLECTYGIDEHFSWGIFQYMHDLFQTSCQVDSWGPDGDWIFCSEQWWYKPLFNQGNASLESASAAFEKISLAITARMRTTGMNIYETEPGRAVGTVTRSAVCIQVYWPWLTLHMVLVVLTGFIFAVILYDSRRLREAQPIWKHSSLVPFFHGLSDEQRDGTTATAPAPVELSSMEDAAAKKIVKLQQCHEGYSFVVLEGTTESGFQSPSSGRTSFHQSIDTESPDVLDAPDFGPRFSASVDESLGSVR